MGKAVQFGCFELDLADNTLRKSGRRVHLQSQPLKVLGALVEASGNIVTRAQLKALVWPSDTFVDFDKSLNTAIMKIRYALGDSAQSPRYLETVPRLGYRFLAPVTILNTPVIQRPEQRASRTGLLLTGCAVAAVMLAASYFVSAFRSQTRQAYLPSVPLTTFAGSEIIPSFSPDDEKIVFAWDGERQHNFDIYKKEIASGRLNRLTDDPHDDLSPTWSRTAGRSRISGCFLARKRRF
jgi:DNA-binding winged helix-turn-helix (wHTH) protein